MGVDLISTLSRKNGANFPIALGEDVIGAFVTVANTAARDAIPTAILRTGAIVRIGGTNSYYEWTGAAWASLSFGGGAGDIKADGTVPFTGNQSMGGNKLTNLGNGTPGSQDATPVAQVEALIAAAVSSVADWKQSVRAATTANITLSGAQTIDGVSVIAGDRVLVRSQSTSSQNGIYVAAAGAWSRATDADASAEVTTGLTVVVEEGTANGPGGTGGGNVFILTTANPITVGTTSLTFGRLGTAQPDGVSVELSGGVWRRAALTGDVTAAAGSNVLTIAAAVVTNANLAGSIAWSKLLTAIGNLSFTGLKSFSFNSEIDNGNSSTADTVDWSAGQAQKSTLTGNCTYTFSNPAANTVYWLRVIQDGTGGRTVTWPAAVTWLSGEAPMLNSAVSGVTLVRFWYDGTTYWGSAYGPLAPSPADGGNLTNANVTKNISDGSKFTLLAGTLASSTKTLTLGTTGTPEDGEIIEVIVYPQSQDFVLKDGGAIGDNLYTVVAGTKRVLHAQWSASASSWRAAGRVRLA